MGLSHTTRPQHKKKRKASFVQLLPFFASVLSFLALNAAYPDVDPLARRSFILFSCCVAIITSFLTYRKKTSLNQKVRIFISGATRPTIVYMSFIFIFSAAFTHAAERIGSIQTAVDCGLRLIPTYAVLPGLFILISTFAFMIGSSLGSIAAFMPIAIGFGTTLSLDTSLLAGIVVGASLLGDNLSLISDTTIAAAKTTGCTMKDKFRTNVFLVFPALVMTTFILFIFNQIHVSDVFLTIKPFIGTDILRIAPYGVILALSIAGVDVLAVLVIGALTAGSIGIALGSFTFLEATSFLFKGFYGSQGMVTVFLLVLLIAGLAKTIEHNGGIEYLVNKWHPRIKSRWAAEVSIALFGNLITSAIVSNTVAILISGPIALRIGTSFGIARERIASLIDIFACISYGLLPYGPPLLLASAICNISPLSIFPYLHYQYCIFVVCMISIIIMSRKQTGQATNEELDELMTPPEDDA